jgi:peptidoglycan-associated lipoprotein
LAQSNTQPGPSTPEGIVTEDSAGRPVQTAPTPEVLPPATPANERQAFRENIKDLYFDFNRSDLRAEDRAALAKAAEWLKAHPGVLFTIEGDADERGDIVYNLFLSDRRALAAREALLKMGVPENQILFAQGWGKLYPVCVQSDESCWSQNRRSHLAAWPPESVTEGAQQASRIPLAKTPEVTTASK